MKETTTTSENIAAESAFDVNKANTLESEEIAAEKEKPYKFRALQAEDVFPMFTIISKIGIKEFKSCFEGDTVKNILKSFVGIESKNEDETLTSMGISLFPSLLEMANIILCNVPKCKADIYQLLSQTSNLSVDEVAQLGFADFTEMIVDFVKKEEFKDFIKVVSKLFK